MLDLITLPARNMYPILLHNIFRLFFFSILGSAWILCICESDSVALIHFLFFMQQLIQSLVLFFYQANHLWIIIFGENYYYVYFTKFQLFHISSVNPLIYQYGFVTVDTRKKSITRQLIWSCYQEQREYELSDLIYCICAAD